MGLIKVTGLMVSPNRQAHPLPTDGKQARQWIKG
jgi:hypothetical protein